MSSAVGTGAFPIRALCSAVGAACIFAGFAGCRGEPEKTSAFPRHETLYVGGRQWGEASSFNPISSYHWPLGGMNSGLNLFYEPLFLYNWQTTVLEPLLGESYRMMDGTTFEVILNPKARWNDGKPVTAADVKFTFDLGKRYKSLEVAPFWKYISEIEVSDQGGAGLPAAADGHPRRVVIHLDEQQRNPLIVLDALQQVKILPRHVIEPLLASVKGDIDEFSKLKFDGPEPAGSGPYRLFSYSSEKIVVQRNDAYWGNQALYNGKMPAPKYIVHPIYKSNDHYSVALQQGRLDVSSTFVPRIWLKREKGVRSWYEKEPYFVSLAIPMFFINVTHRPLNDVRMRRAMAFAINYRDIRELAVSGYSRPLKPGLIVPFGPEAKYYSEEDAEKYGAYYAPEKAKELLREGGYRPIFASNGELVETRDAEGNKVPTVYIKSPAGWTDYESLVRIAVRGMRAVGIDVRERFVEGTLYKPAQFAGDFDLLLDMPLPEPLPSQPWSRFEFLLTSKEWAPEGEKVYKNYGRFNNPAGADYLPRIQALLELIPTLSDESQLLSAYRELNILFMQYQPTLPVVYRADTFYEVSVRHWDNFPTAENPYLPPQPPGDRLGTRMLWQLKPVSQD